MLNNWTTVRELSLLFGFVLVLACRHAGAQEDKPTHGTNPLWDQPAFTAGPQELLEEAARTSLEDDDDAEIELLLEEGRYVFDHDGRLTSETRQVFRILRREAYDNHGVVSANWNPWYQERPEIRARVITPAGRVHELDNSTIEEIRVASTHPNIFTDRMILRAPLPALSIGAIVEVQIHTSEKEKVASSGDLVRFLIGGTDPIRRVQLTVQAPTSLPIKYRVIEADLSPQVSINQDQQVLRIETGPVPALTVFETNLPPDRMLIPLFVATTGDSWSACASEYAEIVERSLKDQTLDTIVSELTGDTATRLEKVSRIMTKVRSGIRYTGVEFGSSAWVPQTPNETLARGYGDCKDKATLAVALLRTAGIEAHVALLDSGPGFDTIPELPSLDHFDHAIVYVPGQPELWIDPTDEFLPVTRLPVSNQGRFALVASPDTEGLVKTPVSRSSENVTHARQEYVLSDTSPNRLTVRTQYDGEDAAEMRSLLTSMTGTERNERYQQIGEENYASEGFANLDIASLEELDRPLIVTEQYDQPGIAVVLGGSAVVVIFPGELLTQLPLALTLPPGSRTDPDRANDDPSELPYSRINPIQLSIPFRRSVTYVVTPPPGYEPWDLPEDQEITVGPARFVMTARKEESQQVKIVCELDTGDGFFTASQVEEMRKKIAAMSEPSDLYDWTLTIQFDQRAASLLAAGNYKEALQEYDRLLRQDPDQSIRHAELALALVEIGLIEAATEHARRAVELDPDNADAQHALGFVALHNELGQQIQEGYSREISITANRRALELDPDLSLVRANLAHVLARNEDATYPSGPDDLRAAIDEYRRVFDETDDETVLDGLLTALHHAGDRKAISEILESASDSLIKTVHRLAMTATTKGISQVRKEAAREFKDPAERRSVLQGLVTTLDFLREYELAIELADQILAEATVDDRFRNFTNLLRTSQRLEDADLEGPDPKHAVLRFLATTLVHGEFHKSVDGLYVNPHSDHDWATWYSELPPWFASTRATLVKGGTSRPRIIDTLSCLSFDVVGNDATGFRVRVKNKVYSSLQWDMFVVRDGDEYRVFRAGDSDVELGERALDHIDAGQIDEARVWLDWALERQNESVGWFDQFSGSPFARVWVMADKRDNAAMRLAAASLATRSERAKDCVAILKTCREGASEVQKLQIDRALLLALIKSKQDEEAIELAQRLMNAHPAAVEPIVSLNYLFRKTGQLDRLRELASQEAKREPHQELNLVVLAEVFTAERDFTDAARHLQQLDERPQLSLSSHIEASWLYLFQQDATGEAFSHARKGAEMTDHRDPEALFLLALASAENGELLQAVNTLALVNARLGLRDKGMERLVWGSIAEHCGLDEIATKIYQQIPLPDHKLPNSAYDLAQLRLERMKPRQPR